jgi:hypothetical protein
MTDFLEKPHPAFGSLPPCPFARKERLAQRLDAAQYSLVSNMSLTNIIERIRQFDQHPTFSTLLIYDPESTISHLEIEAISDQLICTLQDIEMLVIPLHPNATFSPASVHTRRAPYPTLVIQRHKLLSDAQITLLKTPYYNQISEYDERMVLVTNYQCTSISVFFPAYWWSDEALKQYAETTQWPEEIIGTTILQQSSNQIHNWMNIYGDQFGWRFYGDFTELSHIQERITLGGVFLATAHGGKTVGHVELLSKEKPRKSFFLTHYIAKAIWQYTL